MSLNRHDHNNSPKLTSGRSPLQVSSFGVPSKKATAALQSGDVGRFLKR